MEVEATAFHERMIRPGAWDMVAVQQRQTLFGTSTPQCVPAFTILGAADSMTVMAEHVYDGSNNIIHRVQQPCIAEH
ncbi:hypothetical protein NM688_g7065 [Phlebia brevispora]|uniref:Uncharacterized protein n=1 Tax=Phlebia brevispora TaxID=194682 RepID=A0ACC1S9N5_9APHY|nr:hypothetical protein NM688_g7065 [Phlebia brevispora]